MKVSSRMLLIIHSASNSDICSFPGFIYMCEDFAHRFLWLQTYILYWEYILGEFQLNMSLEPSSTSLFWYLKKSEERDLY